MRILLDLDEVLCDFVGGVCNYWAITQDALLPHWEPGSWDIVPPLSRCLLADNRRKEDDPVTTKEFWKELEGQTSFWEYLQPLPWMRQVLDAVARVDPEFTVVTTPSRCTSSYVGKVRWLKKHLGRDFHRFVLTGDKALMAGQNRVLIDDKEENVLKFIDGGGYGILFPRYHNRLYNLRANPLVHILNQLNSLVSSSPQEDLWKERTGTSTTPSATS